MEPGADPQAGEERQRWGSREWLLLLAVATIVFAGRFIPYEPARRVFTSFSWLTEQAVRIAGDLFESYGYLTVFLGPLLENTLFIGAIIPGTLVILLAGISAHDGLISFWPALLLGALGAMIGDTISYGMGRFGWQRLGAESRLASWAEGMREPLMRHNVWLILSYHFAGYSRLVGPAAAGFLRVPFFRWVVLDYIGVSIWVAVFLTGGYILGALGLSLDGSDRSIRIFEAILFGLFIIGVLTVLRTSRARQQREAEATTIQEIE